jgi:hypothetical protein
MKSLALKAFLRFLCVLCIVGGSGLSFALEREAFSITNYDLQLQIDPAQHRLGARGTITLRNDSDTAQKVAVLQISSSLDWRAIKSGDKPLQFVTQPFASDIDHTGGLSEAIVTLAAPVAPHATTDLDIAYEGIVVLDATRLTRIETPESLAISTDWDQIGPEFSAVRGAGYVAWYPIATEVANLSDENTFFEVLARWNAREAGAKAHLKISITQQADDSSEPELILNHPKCFVMDEQISRSRFVNADCRYDQLGPSAPAFVVANYEALQRPHIDVLYLAGHEASAAKYGDVAERVEPLVGDWFGSQHEKAQAADLPHPDDAPFESGALLLLPLVNSSQPSLSAAHQLTHAAFFSFRPWIEEGLAHFAQVLYLEQEKGRQAALDYMGLHRTALTKIEHRDVLTLDNQTIHSLVNTINEELYRSKAMCVWWMLRDMLGDAPLKKAIAAYRPEQDKEPSYMPRLIAAQTQRDLEWFFDDWVYRDRGLPDFKVDSAFSRKALSNTFILAVTVENLGGAGAEVPVIVKFAKGQVSKRLEVRAKDKATIRIETPSAPSEVVVNDGSVPESDLSNNTFHVEPPKE